ncbi:MAG: glycosyltransferase [Gemmatimonadales bacterium]
MRVVFLTHNYPRGPGDVAGGFLHPLAVALRERGVDLRVVAPSDAGHGGRDTLDGIPVHRVRYAGAARETLAYRGTMAEAIRTPGGLSALAGLVRGFTRAAAEELSGGDGVIHAHWWFPAGLAAPKHLPTVVTCHGTDVRLLETNGIARFLGRRVLRRVDMVTTVSRHLAAVVTARTGREVPAHGIQGMPVAQVERSRSRGGDGIIAIGRLTAQKRFDLALRAVARLRARGETHPLTIVGDGPERASLEALAAELGITDITRFSGAVPTAEVPRWLERADLCLATSRAEGLGLSAAEALMQGVPVVACRDGGGLLDIVPDSGGGRLVPPEVDAIAAASRELLDDPGARDAAWALGREWAARLSPDAVAERCLTWYRQALDA